jgi:hypothetical protein
MSSGITQFVKLTAKSYISGVRFSAGAVITLFATLLIIHLGPTLPFIKLIREAFYKGKNAWNFTLISS